MAELSVTTGQSVSLPHKLLWQSCVNLLDMADQRPDHAWSLNLSACLLAAASFEAYINHLGEEILPTVWEEERKHFSNDPYRGLLGKVKRISEELGYPLPPKTHKPFAGWLELQGLRDKIVHARTKRDSFSRVHKSHEFPMLPPTWMSRELSRKKVRELIARLEEFAVEIHSLVAKSEFPEAAFGSHPLKGTLGFAIGDVDQVA